MPIHLDHRLDHWPDHRHEHHRDRPGRAGERPLSRRGFLAGLAAGAGAALLPQGLRSAPDEPAVWALLADTHIDASPLEVNRGFNMAANFRRVLEEVVAARPRGAILDGDVARLTGKPEDYATFLDLAAPLRREKVPLHLTLGNHDHRANLLAAIEDAGERAVEGKWVSARVEDGFHWIFLDSLDRVNATPGRLGDEQVAWLAARLDAEPELPALLFVHHNPEETGSGLQDTARLLETLIPRAQAKAVFFGHTHTWRLWEIGGLQLVNLPAVGYNFADAQPVGWVRARIGREGMDLELRALDPEHRLHGRVESLAFRSAARRRMQRF